MEVLKALHAAFSMFALLFVKDCPRPHKTPQSVHRASSRDCQREHHAAGWLSGLYTNSAAPGGLPKWLMSLCTSMKSNSVWGTLVVVGETDTPAESRWGQAAPITIFGNFKVGLRDSVSSLCCRASKITCLMVMEKTWGQTGIGFLGQTYWTPREFNTQCHLHSGGASIKHRLWGSINTNGISLSLGIKAEST